MGWVRLGALLFGMALVGSCGADAAAGPRERIGQPVEVSVATSPVLATLWVESIRPVTCTEPGSLPPSRGHYLAVTIVLKASPQYEPHWGWWVSAQDFSTVDADGEETGRGLQTSCLPPADFLRDEAYMAGSGYQGIILVDTADESGTLSYSPDNLPAQREGWLWDY
ncbi:hypothetical protein ACFPM7_20840 [Actinokineospora guangxiensis]|uniref:DUF4352 domain-containing protein n=1 Tax=Actinokineospora guangxiensis TaxID=1490288 RepID=A0ABW0ERK9_9PSEU